MTVIRGTARSILDALPQDEGETERRVGGVALVSASTDDDVVRELEARGVLVERSPWVGERDAVWTADAHRGER